MSLDSPEKNSEFKVDPLIEDDFAKKERIDRFFSKMEENRKNPLTDELKLPDGIRYMTTDGEVYLYKGKESGYTADPQKKADNDNIPPRDEKRQKIVEANKKRKAKRRKKDQKRADRPAKKKSIVGRIIASIFRIILIIGCLGIIAGCVAAVSVSIYLVNVTKDDDKILNLNTLPLSYATILEYQDRETGEWVEYQRLFSGENRVWVKYDEMPRHLIDALVASEDKRFWEHKGVDWQRTIAAFLNEYIPSLNLFPSRQGGSTLVQQLIKNITGDDETDAMRKIREIYRALVLEKYYSREQILEAYLNTFNLGGKVGGIEAAANYYFDKSCSELTIAESAAIVCITKQPTKNNPYLNPGENRIQRDTIINQMKEQGYLTDSQFTAAKKESEYMVFGKPNEKLTGTNVYSYMTDTVIAEIYDDLVNILGWEPETALEKFNSGGYRVKMTMDPFIQSTVEEVALNGRRTEEQEAGYTWPKYEDGYIWPWYTEDGRAYGEVAEIQPQSAMVVMNYEGEILGIAGGLGEKTGSLELNRAVDSKRPTGSSMKPLAAYGPGIEVNRLHFSMLFPDQPLPPYTIPGYYRFPDNYDSSYGVPVTVAEGIARSLNTTAVHAIRRVGIDFSFDFMRNFVGLDTLSDPEDRTHSLALGGLHTGISPLDMCAAYAPFGNGGTYYSPHSYSMIVDANGEVLINKKNHINVIQAYSEPSAFIMNKLLRNVMYSGWGGTGVRARPDGDMPYVGKSGTHSENKDYWFIGMNPYYVMSIWQGYDQPKYQNNIRPHPIQIAFKKVMGTISADLEVISFPTPPEGTVKTATFCKDTGLIAGEGCPDRRTGYYKPEMMPDGVCNHALDAPRPEDYAPQPTP
ncbi:MAG: hypothetical protein GX222_03765 [Ruminococcaceae bacterium]|nr:hypothetical protein [Oscillospiraceae bacterium]